MPLSSRPNSAHPALPSALLSSSPSSSLSSLFRSLTFFLLPGCHSVPLVRTIVDHGGVAEAGVNLPSSALTPSSAHARRAMTTAWERLMGEGQAKGWIVVVEAREARKVRALISAWKEERAGEWGDAKEGGWLKRAASVRVYDAGWVFNSRRKAALQPLDEYRTHLMDDAAEQSKAAPQPKQQQQQQQAGARPVAGGKKRTTPPSPESPSDEEGVGEGDFDRPRPPPHHPFFKRARVEPAKTRTGLPTAASRKAASAAQKAPLTASPVRRRQPIAVSSDDESKAGGDGRHEEKRPFVRLQRVRQASTASVEALSNQLEARSARKGKVNGGREPAPLHRTSNDRMRLEGDDDEDEDDDEDGSSELGDGKYDEPDERKQHSEDGGDDERREGRPPLSTRTGDSASPPPFNAHTATARGGVRDSEPRIQSDEEKTPHRAQRSAPGKSLAGRGAASGQVGATASPIDLTLSQQRAEASDVIYETPQSQPVSSGESATPPLPTASSSSSHPQPLPPSSAPLPTLPLSLPLPVPVVLHALFVHSGSAVAAAQHLQGASTPSPAWEREEDKALNREDSAAVMQQRGLKAVQMRKSFLRNVQLPSE